MFLVTSIVEMVEEYTLLLARTMEELLHDAPVPRPIRAVMQPLVTFASSHSHVPTTAHRQQQTEITYFIH